MWRGGCGEILWLGGGLGNLMGGPVQQGLKPLLGGELMSRLKPRPTRATGTVGCAPAPTSGGGVG
jgi:hypothetical protein